ncbi:hypothetical protein C8F01DRAFT_1091205 [Mycena amicta]|nr:hypothetical protein C8F01DRAFT_1091205 [Mycena amicta]
MGQYWRLVNLDTRQASHGGKLGEILFEGVGKQVYVYLRQLEFPPLDEAVREYPSGLAIVSVDKANKRCVFRYGLCALVAKGSSEHLTDLHTELIDEIFTHLADPDIVAFSMTCQLIWAIGRRHIYACMKRNTANCEWAGHRLVVVGDYLENDAVPEALLAGTERSELLQHPHPDAEDEDEDEDEYYKDYTPSLYDYAFHEIPDWTIWKAWFGPHSLDILHSRSWRRDWRLFQELTHYAPTRSPTDTQPKVLRNLTKREYVLENAVHRLVGKYPPGSDLAKALRDVTLGDVVYCRICWSSEAGTNLGYQKDIHQGVWAGDRFDIVEEEWLKELELGGDGEQWIDVTTAAVDEIEEIWRLG